MKCKKCGRPLQANEKELCPHCKNERDGKIKDGFKIGGGVLAVLVAVGLGLLKILGGKGGDKS